LIENFNNLGEGSQGIVNKFKDKNCKFVAIKTYNNNDFDNDDFLDTTLKEICMLQKLKDCPYIIQLLDINVSDKIIFMILPFIEQDLSIFIKTTPFIERINHSDNIIRQLLEALLILTYSIYIEYVDVIIKQQYCCFVIILYQFGIIHGDIKPQNILIDNNHNIYLADFGCSTQLFVDKSYRQKKVYMIGYTTAYAPPEYHGHYSDKSDIYDMGITFIEYFIGKNFLNITFEDSSSNLISKYPCIGIFLNIESTGDALYILKNNFNHFISENNYINSEKVFESYLEDYKLIPKDKIGMINSMLYIDKSKRAHITELISIDNINYKTNEITLKRNNVLIEHYYDLINIIIITSKLFRMVGNTCIIAIDLFDRYISNYEILIDELKLIAYTCLLLASKLNEYCSPELGDFEYISENSIKSEEIMNMQYLILQRFNYNIITSEIDIFLNKLNISDNKSYDKILNLYNILKDKNLYPNSLTYEELCEFV